MQDALDKAILKDQRSDMRHAVLRVDICHKQSKLLYYVVLLTLYYIEDAFQSILNASPCLGSELFKFYKCISTNKSVFVHQYIWQTRQLKKPYVKCDIFV